MGARAIHANCILNCLKTHLEDYKIIGKKQSENQWTKKTFLMRQIIRVIPIFPLATLPSEIVLLGP